MDATGRIGGGDGMKAGDGAAAGKARRAAPPKAARGRGRPNSRELMLDAAQAVVLEQGAGRLTLDAVARRAGVSKGGVMYNFPTKQALLTAMLERLVEHNRRAHAALVARLPAKRGRSLRAYVMNSVRAPDVDDRVSGALLAALNGDPALLQPVSRYFNGRFAAIAEDMPFEQAAIVYLATEGLWIQELLQLSSFSKPQRARVVRALLRMAEPGQDQAAAASGGAADKRSRKRK